MSSPSPERGRTRSRQQTSAYAKDPVPSKSRSSPRRSITPRSRTQSRSPPVVEEKLHRAKERRSRSRSPERSRSRSRGHDGSAHRYRDRSYTRSVSKDSPVPRSSKIVVEKLTKNVNESHLYEIFGQYGSIASLDLPMNRQFMTNRGTAYIIYTQTPDAEAAIAHMHEAQLDGAVISVSIVLPRRKFSRSPPPSRQNGPAYDRFEGRGPISGSYRGGPSHPAYGPPNGSRRGYSPPPPRRGSPPRRYGGRSGPGPRDRDYYDNYRPRSYSRSRSPRRTRSPSYSSRSRSRTPPPRRGGGGYGRRYTPPPPRRGGGGGGEGGGPDRGRRRRSPSYSSYSSYSDRSRSRSRGRYGRGR